jgi:hypothetical protein
MKAFKSSLTKSKKVAAFCQVGFLFFAEICREDDLAGLPAPLPGGNRAIQV